MTNIEIIDPFNITEDPKMPFLLQALNPFEVKQQFENHVHSLSSQAKQIQLQAIRTIRYKPKRRCLIEYDITVKQFDGSEQAITLIGKARSRGLDRRNYSLVKSLWEQNFGKNSKDDVFVPEPMGMIESWNMWFQRKVPGIIATKLLVEPEGIKLARRIAQAAHKLHQAGISSHRVHTIADELQILRDRISIVAEMFPEQQKRLAKILDACDRLGASIPEVTPQGIHRDFYPDQIIVDRNCLYLLDMDLYCQGDPSLDIGNFIGHIIEQSLRTSGKISTLADREAALTKEFLRLSSTATRSAVESYTTLTLVRHIYLSTQFSARQPFTNSLIELCEQRLDLAGY